jgi:hypothetical protein
MHLENHQSRRITEACQLLMQQDDQIAAGALQRRNWLPIAKQCIAGFEGFRTISARNRQIRRLQNAASQRLARQRHANSSQSLETASFSSKWRLRMATFSSAVRVFFTRSLRYLND